MIALSAVILRVTLATLFKVTAPAALPSPCETCTNTFCPEPANLARDGAVKSELIIYWPGIVGTNSWGTTWYNKTFLIPVVTFKAKEAATEVKALSLGAKIVIGVFVETSGAIKSNVPVLFNANTRVVKSGCETIVLSLNLNIDWAYQEYQ